MVAPDEILMFFLCFNPLSAKVIKSWSSPGDKRTGSYEHVL